MQEKTNSKIISYIKKNGQVTGSELTNFLNISDRAVRKQLRKMLDNDVLAKLGKPPKVFYMLKNEHIEQKVNLDKRIADLIKDNYLKLWKNWKKEKDNLKKIGRLLLWFGLVLVMVGVLGGGWLSGWDKQSLNKRWSLNIYSLGMIKDNWLVGVGKNNFLVELPDYEQKSRVFWLQPVHNIFLLLFSELGIFGLLVVKKWLREYRHGRKIKKEIWLILGVIMAIGLVDHYCLSLIQNWWLLGLVLGL